jgi:predicted MPP superfamily phosphohydrolase
MPWFLSVLLTVFVPLVVVHTYVGIRLVRALVAWRSWPRRTVRRWVHGTQLALNLFPVVALLTFWISGRQGMGVFNGESVVADLVLVYPFWFGLVIVAQVAFLLLIWDCARLLAIFVFRADRERWRRWNRNVLLIGSAAVALYTIPATIRHTFFPRVSRYDISVDERFRALDGLKILQISDVQGDGRTTSDRVRRFVQMGNDLGADLVINCGDFVTSGEKYISSTVAELTSLRGSVGTFAVVGDHDIFSGIKAMVLEEVRATGITMLEDTSIVIQHNGIGIALTFVTYTYPQRPDSLVLDRAMTLSDSLFRIVLVHQPAIPLVHKAAEKQYDLFLAGHTHGGGVAFGLPILGYIAPASFETRYVSGLYTVGKMIVSVTNGLGFTLAPIRYNAPIELTLLTLRATGSSPE